MITNKIIDVDKIANAIGVPLLVKEENGRKSESYQWTPELLIKGLEYIKPELEGDEPITLTGSGIHWMMAAFAIALGNNFKVFKYPHKIIDVFDLKMGRENPEGGIHFKVCNENDKLYVDFDPDDYTKPFPEGPHNYEMSRLPMVAVPPCIPEQHVFYSCNGAFNIFINIVKTYVGKCKSINISPGHGDDSGYVCVYSNCDEMKIGDISPFHYFKQN